MKKNSILIVLISVILIIIAFFIINSFNKDKKIMEDNIVIINDNYDNFKTNVLKYNDIRKEVSTIINNFMYDKIEGQYTSNIELLNNYQDIIEDFNKTINNLDSKCKYIYKDKNINNICNSYKKDYEILVNVYVNDINTYNNKINTYNKDNNKTLKIFNNKLDYIDYNKDNIYEKRINN